MKNIILSISIGLVSLTTYAQKETYVLKQTDFRNEERKSYYSGLELQTYAKHHYTGLGLTISGSILIVSGILIIQNNNNNSNVIGSSIVYNQNTNSYDTTYFYGNSPNKGLGIGMTIVGGVLSLIGTYYTIEAPIHIRNAGLILSGNGIGIRIKL
jgi:hypothetical protein